jgi:hypothetical protein
VALRAIKHKNGFQIQLWPEQKMHTRTFPLAVPHSCPGTGHMEDVALNYEKITPLYKNGNLLAHDACN